MNVSREINDRQLPQLTIIEINKFAEFLTTPMGRALNPITIQQHKSQLKLLTMYAPSHHPNDLLSKKMLNEVISKLMLPYNQGGRAVQASTARNYITTIIHYINFLDITYTDEPQLHARLETLKNSVKNMSYSYKAKSAENVIAIAERDLDRMPTPQEIRQYDKSLVRRQIIQKLEEVHRTKGKIVLDSWEVTDIFGYFVLEQCFANAPRTGDIANMTLHEYHRRQAITGGYQAIKVSMTKCKNQYGGAYINFSPELFLHLRIYVHYIRPHLAEKDSGDTVFLNSKGKKYKSSTMIASMQKIWVQISRVTSVTPTLLRKTMATRYLEKSEADQNALARKMNHKRDTHNARYVLHNQKLTNQQLAPHLRDAMLGRRTTAKETTPAKVISLFPSSNDDTLIAELAPSTEAAPLNEAPASKEPLSPGLLVTMGKSILKFLTCNYLLLN